MSLFSDEEKGKEKKKFYIKILNNDKQGKILKKEEKRTRFW